MSSVKFYLIIFSFPKLAQMAESNQIPQLFKYFRLHVKYFITVQTPKITHRKFASVIIYSICCIFMCKTTLHFCNTNTTKEKKHLSFIEITDDMQVGMYMLPFFLISKDLSNSSISTSSVDGPSARKSTISEEYVHIKSKCNIQVIFNVKYMFTLNLLRNTFKINFSKLQKPKL